jgi:hypothetical protein
VAFFFLLVAATVPVGLTTGSVRCSSLKERASSLIADA